MSEGMRRPPEYLDYEETITRMVADVCFDAHEHGEARSNRFRGRMIARQVLALLRPDLSPPAVE